MHSTSPTFPPSPELALVARHFAPQFTMAREPHPQRAPNPNEVVVRTEAAGLNHIDLLALSGTMPLELQPKAPFIPGVEGAGHVIAVGTDVTTVSVGERVLWFGALGVGGLATTVTLPATHVAPIAADVADTHAAAVPVAYVTALHMLRAYTTLAPGAWVLVHGAGGGVGQALVALATLEGHRVIATDSAGKRNAVLAAGAARFVDYRTENLADMVQDATGGEGVALSLNAVGGDSVSADLELLRPFGAVVLYGFLAGLPSGTLVDTLVPHFARSVSVHLSDIYTLANATPARFHTLLTEVAGLLSTGKIRPTPHVFDDVTAAFDAMRAKTHPGKRVVTADAWRANGARRDA